MRNFSPFTLSLAMTLASAQLPQECFLHSDQMGSVGHGQYESDLPLLELKYDPDMELDSVTGLLGKSGELVGVQLKHVSEAWSEELKLRHVGGSGVSKNKVSFREGHESPIEMVAIVYDVNFEYVCNIYLGFD